MDSGRPVVAPPTANTSPQSNNFFKCPKKVWLKKAVFYSWKVYYILQKHVGSAWTDCKAYFTITLKNKSKPKKTSGLRASEHHRGLKQNLNIWFENTVLTGMTSSLVKVVKFSHYCFISRIVSHVHPEKEIPDLLRYQIDFFF